MKKILLCAIIATFGFLSCTQQASKQASDATSQRPKVEVDESKILSLLYDDDLMVAAKEAYLANDPKFMPLFNRFKKFVDENYLHTKNMSIVEGKTATAPSRDPRDYISQSPYWWPDPENPGGPYIRFDGVRNPELDNYPESFLGSRMGDATQTLGMMYYLTGDEEYSKKAEELLRHFFLKPETGMNPNMYFAQYVPGMERIRGTGIIDAGRIVAGLNAAKLIEPSVSWKPEYEAQLKDWAEAFVYWLENSTQGRYEKRGGNNHGMWYESTLQTVVLYTGDYDHLQHLILDEQLPRIPRVITADSLSPHEVARTRGLSYCTFMIEAVNRSIVIGEKIGIDDGWSYTGENGRNMSMNIDFLIKYWLEPETWPFMQIIPYEQNRAAMILQNAGTQLGNQRYLDLAQELGVSCRADFDRVPSIDDLLYYKLTK